MLIVTTDTISGRELEMLGLVAGSTIQCKHIGKDIGAGFKNLVGGEMKAYTEMVEEARAVATNKMVQQALDMGANAVVGFRYATTSVVQGGAELVAYGTAVRLR